MGRVSGRSERERGALVSESAITSFRGEYDFLSNFYICKIRMYGMDFPSVEHAYQAAKSFDPVERDVIRRRPTPGAAKKAGSAIKLRPGWEKMKLGIMDELLRQKFRDPVLMGKLTATYPRKLVEGNTWGDSYWGMAPHSGRWYGENHLGKLLMKIRDEVCIKRNLIV